MTTCPACGTEIVKPHKKGLLGKVLLNRYLRILPDDTLVIVCRCGAELERHARTGRLIVHRREVSTKPCVSS